jgi:DNA (cytosine-5)-methyltransferase 1
MTRGFLDTGRFDPVLAVEHDKRAAASYDANFPGHVFCGPIQDVDVFPLADLVIGGPPCQGFSALNMDRVGLDRRELWREYVRALEQSNAKVFVMENVPELLTSPEFEDLRVWAREHGYTLTYEILNAADYGVPQRRRRAIVIGSRTGEPFLPAATHCRPGAQDDACEPWQTFRQAVEGLPLAPDGTNWHVPRNPRPESVRRYRAVPHDGGNRFQMQANLDRDGLGHLVPRCWREKPTGTTDVFGRLWWDRPSLTVRTEFYKPEKGRYLHPSEDRPITVREAARLQTFSDDFAFGDGQSMTAVSKQIGNAVPPLLALRIAEAVAEHLDM